MKEVAGIVAAELPEWNCRVVPMPSTMPHPESRGTDFVAIATLVLSVPPAILAAWDLAERLRVKERIDRLLSRLQERTRDSQYRATLVGPDGRATPVDMVATKDVLDGIAASASEFRSVNDKEKA